MVRLTVRADKAGVIDGKHHMQLHKRHVVQKHIIGAL